MTIHPAPKPRPALPKPKGFNSTLSMSEKPLGQNTERREDEFARCYESLDRVEWIRWLGCVICGKKPCDNAHVRGGGAGRKADARFVVPLCKGRAGHHRELHNEGIETFEASFSIDLEATAARIDEQWQAHKARGA